MNGVYGAPGIVFYLFLGLMMGTPFLIAFAAHAQIWLGW